MPDETQSSASAAPKQVEIVYEGTEKARGTKGTDVVNGQRVIVLEPVEKEQEDTSPDEIKALTEYFSALLSSPAVLKVLEVVKDVRQAQALAQVETAKVQAQAQLDTLKAQLASNGETHKRNVEVANRFLVWLGALGFASLTLLGIIAWTKIVDGQVFSVLATVVITSIFGGTIYGTTLRNKDKD